METLFYLLSLVQIGLGIYAVWQGLEWLGYARRRMQHDPGFHAPRVAVLCPCKGLEPGLERNLVALTEFDHQNYELFFVVAAESDAAYGIAKRVAASSKHKAQVVVAGPAEGCGEKVNNLRAAIAQLDPEFGVLVFADSDGRPGKSWLQRLTAPLADSRIGATTTMRWFIPNRSNFATFLLAAWNAPVVTMLTEKGKNFCWGGGTAIRRELFDEIGMLDEWQNSVSDDFSMTRAVLATGRSILFVPECLTPSFVETDFASLLEFTNRQILITRVYAEKMWAMALGAHLLYCITLILGIVLTLGDVALGRPSFHLAALTFLPVLLSAMRGALRVATVSELMPTYKKQLMAESWVYILLNCALPFFYLVNFANSLITRKMWWRGVRYQLISEQQTRILSH